VKGVAVGLGEMRFSLTSFASIQDVTSNDTLNDSVVVKYGLDAALSHNTTQISGVEGIEIQGTFAGWSYGVQGSSNAVATVELPPEVHFARASARNEATTTCSIVDPQHLRCVYNIPANQSFQLVDYSVVADAAGAFQAKATIVLPGDQNPGNDSVQWGISIDPVIDLGVRAFTVPEYLIAGHPLTLPLTLFAGSRAVVGANATISTNTSALVDSVITNAGTCTRLNQWQFQCVFGDLPARGEVSVSAVVSASSLMGAGTFTVQVGSPGDNVPQNDFHFKSFYVVPETNVGVSVGGASVTGTAGTGITLPSIVVSRSGGDAVQPILRFSLPDGVSVVSMSGALGICSGTREFECSIPTIPAGGSLQLDLIVRTAGPMTFNVPVSVSALNDFQPANDTTSFAVTVTAAAPPVSPPTGGGGGTGGKGGGGGGRMEWSVLMCLAMLLWRRRGIARRTWRVPAMRGNGLARVPGVM
jgi:hypothetical protein